MSDKLIGNVKYFNEGKGFGFISCNGKDYFVHFSDIVGEGFRTLAKDELVTFKLAQSDRGPKAVMVSRAS